MGTPLFDWAVMEATVNGRSLVGMAGVRDPDAECEAFDPGDPGHGRCDTDGHYLCMECKEMSDEALCFRTEICCTHRRSLISGCCPECDRDDQAILGRAVSGARVAVGTSGQ